MRASEGGALRLGSVIARAVPLISTIDIRISQFGGGARSPRNFSAVAQTVSSKPERKPLELEHRWFSRGMAAL